MISNLPRSRFGLTFIKVKRHNHRIRKTYFMLRGVTLNGVLKRAWISTTVKCNCFKDAYKVLWWWLNAGRDSARNR